MCGQPGGRGFEFVLELAGIFLSRDGKISSRECVHLRAGSGSYFKKVRDGW